MNDIYTIDILPIARHSTEERGAYIEEQGNPFAAENYISGLYGYVDKCLGHNPAKFRSYDYIQPGLRLLFYKKTTTIVYTIDEVNKIVTVTNIFHTRQDYINYIR